MRPRSHRSPGPRGHVPGEPQPAATPPAPRRHRVAALVVLGGLVLAPVTGFAACARQAATTTRSAAEQVRTLAQRMEQANDLTYTAQYETGGVTVSHAQEPPRQAYRSATTTLIIGPDTVILCRAAPPSPPVVAPTPAASPPAGKASTPAGKATTPAAKGSTSAGKASSPAAKASSPAAKHATPAGGQSVPSQSTATATPTCEEAPGMDGITLPQARAVSPAIAAPHYVAPEAAVALMLRAAARPELSVTSSHQTFAGADADCTTVRAGAGTAPSDAPRTPAVGGSSPAGTASAGGTDGQLPPLRFTACVTASGVLARYEGSTDTGAVGQMTLVRLGLTADSSSFSPPAGAPVQDAGSLQR